MDNFFKKPEFKQFVYDLLDEAFALSATKGQDYRKGSNLVHQNFINVGNNLDLPPLRVLGVYSQKHFDAITSFIESGGQSESEPIRERIKDAINYILLSIPLAGRTDMTEQEFINWRASYIQSKVFPVVAEVPLRVPNSMPQFDLFMVHGVREEDPEALKQLGKWLIANLIIRLYFYEQSVEG